jgi:hypothetical protein
VTDQIDSFIDKIRQRPAFAAAGPVFSKHLDAIEFALNEIDRRADEDPEMVEAFDKVIAVIANNRRTLRERLLDLNEVLVPLRDALFAVRH